MTETIRLVYEIIRELITGRAKSRRDLYDALLKPLYDGMGTVHTEYRRMFLNAEALLQESEIGAEGGTSEPSDAKLVVARRSKACQAARDYLVREREQNITFRFDLRERTRGMMEAVSNDTDRRFLISVLCYFLGVKIPGDATAWRILLDDVERQGADFFSTPSSRLSAELEQGDAPTMREEIQGHLRELDRAFRDLAATFGAVQGEVLGAGIV